MPFEEWKKTVLLTEAEEFVAFRAWQACEAQMAEHVRELEMLMNIPDAEIDTSDIPEVSDWSKAQRGKFYRTCEERVRSAVEESRKQLSIESMEREPCGHFKSNLIGDEYGHFLCDACQIETKRVRSAVAEFRDRATRTIQAFRNSGTEQENWAAAMETAENHIRALPLDGPKQKNKEVK